MSNEITEVQLTAYALGELFGPERAAVEAHVATNETARFFVEDVRSTGKLIAQELSNEPIVGLLAVHHAAIERRLEEPVREMKLSMGPEQLSARRRRWVAFGMSIAASVLIVIGTLAVLAPSLYGPLGKKSQLAASSQPFIVIQSEPIRPGIDMVGGVAMSTTSPTGIVQQPPITLSKAVGYDDILMYPSNWPEGTRTLIADPADPQAAGRNRPADQAVMAQLARPLPEVTFDGIELGEVVDFLRDVSSTKFEVNWKSLEATAGIKKETLVRTRLRNIKFSDAIQTILKSVDPAGRVGFEVQDGKILISSVEDLAASSEEAYARIVENPFLRVTQNPLSTFSVDVDTASYANARRFLSQGQLPPPDAVRAEEFINYFPYDYEGPKDDKTPFAAHIEVAGCPWNKDHRLVRVGLKGKEIETKERPAANLVFLVDVSGSMNEPNKLPLVKQSLRMLIEKLRDDDRVALVVYAGNSGLVLPGTEAKNRQTIVDSVEKLEAGGSTNGGKGIELAYATAAAQFIKNGINRVILCTDGDFNVGVTNEGDLTRLIEDKAKSGVFLSVLGFGMGNLKDSTMEKLADKGNGNYGYIDTQLEAYKLLVEQMSGTLVTIAKDVKIQVEFNPTIVGGYRLIGYENRMLAKEDFNDDKKDAGEIGAGHAVTALYEVIPAGKEVAVAPVDSLKYQRPMMIPVGSDEMLTLKLRYKAPAEDVSKLVEFSVKDAGATYAQATGDFKFAASVAEFAMLLRDSQFKGTGSFDAVLELGAEGKGADQAGYRGEFLELVKKAKELKKA